MKLYFLRHADAGIRNPEVYPDDSLRPLTNKGRRQLEKVSKFLEKQQVPLDLVFSSPFVRASQTAQFVRKSLELKKEKLVVTPHLAPLGDVAQLIQEVTSRQPLEHVLLVGHEPDLSLLISLLLVGDSSALTCRMKKASLCCLTVDELIVGKCATLEWLWHPDF
ncbi:MAG: phosphohistidine phosphatase SixA [Anaerolineales bacterium]|nr:phosphohistidine phosphatase SixA [Anaerolineales bacterium]MCX7609912.1 phosphohistidine phosphatase SixA [Anaerolineales bacterium]